MSFAVGNWEKEWKATKKRYETVTGKSKPSEKFLKFGRKKTGIAKLLKKLDATCLEAMVRPTEESFEAFADAFEKADAAANAYKVTLVKAWNAEKKNTERDETKLISESINVLIKELDAVMESAHAQLVNLRKAMGKSRAEAVKMMRSHESLNRNLGVCIKKGALFVARAKRDAKGDFDEGLDFVRENINHAARDITQCIGNLNKSYEDARDKRAKSYKMGVRLFDAMSDWAQNGRNSADVAQIADQQGLDAFIRKFETMLKVVMTYKKDLTAPQRGG